MNFYIFLKHWYIFEFQLYFIVLIHCGNAVMIQHAFALLKYTMKIVWPIKYFTWKLKDHLWRKKSNIGRKYDSTNITLDDRRYVIQTKTLMLAHYNKSTWFLEIRIYVSEMHRFMYHLKNIFVLWFLRLSERLWNVVRSIIS